jgi:CheY-like chemotaxis protein
VLVVDDEADVREVIADFLELLGCDVHTAANGREALDNLARARPNLILLDYMMPVMDGRTFGMALRRQRPYAEVPIVLMTAFPQADDVGQEIGAMACLRKPFDMDELAHIVESVTGQ